MMASPNFQVTLHAEPMMQQQQPPNYAAAGLPEGGVPPPPRMPVNIRFDTSYIRTFPGILKIIQIVTNVIGMICIMVSKCSWCSNSNWFNFVASTGLTVTGLLLVAYLLHIIEKVKFIPWVSVEMLYCAVWTLFYMIAALIVAVKGGRDDAWAAAGFFGFVGTIVYAVDCYVKYKCWNTGTPAQGEKPPSPAYAAY